MKLKLDDKGNVVLQDGKPVYVKDDGTEIAFDAPGTVATINRLNGEARGHREAKEAAETKLKSFEGIEDGEAARKALELAKNIKDGELIAANKVQEIKDNAIRTAQEQVAAAAKAAATREQELTALLEKRTGELNNHMIGTGFSSSKLLTDDKHPSRLAIPAEMARAYFGNQFKVEDGKTIGYDQSGNKIYSSVRPGELADFDEAFDTMVRSCPFKDQILKSSGASGGGASGQKAAPGNGKQISRSQFESMGVEERGTLIKQGVSVTD